MVPFLFPLAWMFMSSRKTQVQNTAYPPVWVFAPTLSNYREVFQKNPFFTFTVNSLVVALGSTGLALLLIAYIFNFLDRTILSILAGPIIKDLRLTDTEFGLLSGPPFAVLYSILGVPFAYLADRTSRSRVIAGALAVWSGFTALCGTAGAFWQLFVFRMGVGVGEAGGVAPSYALIADYFPPANRARALAVFSKLTSLVPRSVVSAITQTPASGPFELVTTPPISSLSMLTAARSALAGGMSVEAMLDETVPRTGLPARPARCRPCR